MNHLPNDAKARIKDMELTIRGVADDLPGADDRFGVAFADAADRYICNSYGVGGMFCTDAVISSYEAAGIRLGADMKNARDIPMLSAVPLRGRSARF